MIRQALTWTLALLCAQVSVSALPQRPPDETLYQIQVYDGLIETYRSGDLPATLAKLDAMLVSRTANRQLATWLKSASEKRRIGSVECVMLIYTEAVYDAWRKNLPLALNDDGAGRVAPYGRQIGVPAPLVSVLGSDAARDHRRLRYLGSWPRSAS
jgi:hypothetical protein